MKSQLCTIVFLFNFCFLKAQHPSYNWVKSSGSTGADAANSIVVDASGNVYTLGRFTFTIDLDPGPGAFTVAAVSGGDIYIQKLDPMGNFVWGASFDAGIDIIGNSLALDANNIYLNGVFSGTVDFDPGPAVQNMTATSNNIFVLKLTTAGAFVWAKQISGASNNLLSVFAIAIDNSSNVYTAGLFNGTPDFDPGAGSSPLTSSGAKDAYILKLDNAGNFVWVKNFGGLGSAEISPYTISADLNGNVAIGGFFNGTIDFDPGVANFPMTSAFDDAFAVKLDQTGNFLWAKSFGSSSGSDNVHSSTFDALGNLYTTGRTQAGGDFDPGPGVFTLPGYNNSFVLKLDPAGNFLWAKSIGGPNAEQGNTIAVDNQNNVYTAGYAQPGADLDPGNDTYIVDGSGAVQKIYITKLSPNGDFLWARSLGGSSTNSTAYGITLDLQNDIYFAGSFEGTVNLHSSSGTATLTSNGDTEAYVCKWSQCGTQKTIIDTSICKRLFQSNTYTSSGNYYHYSTNVAGCDSITLLKLTVQEFTSSISNVNGVLIVNTPSATSYQWLSCNLSTSLAGQTSQTYSPVFNGNYAITVVSSEGCVYTTSCVAYTEVGIGEGIRSGLVLSAYPNPVKDRLTIELSQTSEFITAEIFDVFGRKLESRTVRNSSAINLDLNYPAGIYLAIISTAEGGKSIKIVKD